MSSAGDALDWGVLRITYLPFLLVEYCSAAEISSRERYGSDSEIAKSAGPVPKRFKAARSLANALTPILED